MRGDPGDRTEADPALPPGFGYVPGFLAPDEEAGLRRRVAALPLEPFRMRGFEARRLVGHFGYAYAYDARTVESGEVLPEFLRALRPRAAALAGVAPEELAEALVTRYPPGAGIGWHRDAPAFGRVVGISLGAPARLRLRRGGAGGERREIRLEPGSAYALAGAARWAWQHSIPPVAAERFSITFRTMRPDGDRRPRAGAS